MRWVRRRSTSRSPAASAWRPGIVVHQTASLRPHEVRERHGIPVTAPIRTLFDFAGVCVPAELERAVAEAFALGLTNRAAMLRAANGARGRRGTKRLTSLLGGGPPARTRSRPERLLLRAVRDAGLPEPETDVKIGRWTVDFLGAKPASWSRSMPTRPTPRRGRSNAIAARTLSSRRAGSRSSDSAPTRCVTTATPSSPGSARLTQGVNRDSLLVVAYRPTRANRGAQGGGARSGSSPRPAS